MLRGIAHPHEPLRHALLCTDCVGFMRRVQILQPKPSADEEFSISAPWIDQPQKDSYNRDRQRRLSAGDFCVREHGMLTKKGDGT